MIASGLSASQQQGRARLSLPAGFVAGDAPGSVSLAASVVVLGACVALGVSTGCGLLHGHAHAMDLVSAASSTHFADGRIAATALLHAFGASMGAVAPSFLREVSIRAGGAAIAAGLAQGNAATASELTQLTKPFVWMPGLGA
jgi:urease accessory protein